MHKKLEADLISLAHSILTMKNKDDVFALKEKSKAVYEKLSMLAFVEEYVNTTPSLEIPKEELLKQVSAAFEAKENPIDEKIDENETDEAKVVYDLIDEPESTPKKEESLTQEIKPKTELAEEEKVHQVEEITEQPFDELEDLMFTPKEIIEEVSEDKIEKNESDSPILSDVIKVEERKTMSLEEELQDTISVDLMADLFENAQPKSLNDRLAKNVQIGLNDRIAFVKKLFDGDQENYNRVVSQLNTFKSENDAKNFVNKMVKPDYDWSEQEDLEIRFMEIIERKFA
ncbi:hypothetical protein [Polaribacter sp.]|uniref:hypothetical protein n=1 Tax=Polaribacter sp. TaxID=1920175 RepID=UPI00262436C4|nr:hypothetical protein [Polaribacter sp.]MDG1404284.1 hypothetical protein [Polaribacter sp.]